MLFDSLNINKSEFLNTTGNSKQDDSIPKNKAINGVLSETITPEQLESGNEEYQNITFNQYLDAISDTNDIQNQVNAKDEQPQNGNPFPLVKDDIIKNENIELEDSTNKVIDLSSSATPNDTPLFIENFKRNDLEIKINVIENKDLQVLSKEVSAAVKEKHLVVNEIPKLISEISPLINNEADFLKGSHSLGKGNSTINFLESEKLVNLDATKVTHKIPLEENIRLGDKLALGDKLSLDNKLNLNILDKDSMVVLNRNAIVEENPLFIKGKNGLDNVRLVDNLTLAANLSSIGKTVKLQLENISTDNRGTVDLVKTDLNENTLLTSFTSVIKPITDHSLLPEPIVLRQPLTTNGQFANGLGIRIQWMLQQALSSAQIMLDPPELGPMNVKLVQAGSEMNIVFQVQTAQGKDAIEDNLAKLKEMLLAQGINLGETEIQHKQKDQDEDKQQSLTNNENDSELQDSSDLDASKNIQSNVALLDTYF